MKYIILFKRYNLFLLKKLYKLLQGLLKKQVSMTESKNVSRNIDAIVNNVINYSMLLVHALVMGLFNLGALIYLMTRELNIDDNFKLTSMLMFDIFYIFIDILINIPSLFLNIYFKKFVKMIWIILTLVFHIMNIDFYFKVKVKGNEIEDYIFICHMTNILLYQSTHSFVNIIQICFE